MKYKFNFACIVSRLLYGLQAAWLIKVARDRLDGFHAKCLRQILGIAPSYYSRISNETVLQQLQAPKLSELLLQQQLNFFGRVARRSSLCPVRRLIFANDGLTLQDAASKRIRGRPRQTWPSEIFRRGVAMAGPIAAFESLIVNEQAWKEAVRLHCRSACSQ